MDKAINLIFILVLMSCSAQPTTNTPPPTVSATATRAPIPTAEVWPISQPHNACVGIASVRVKFGVQADVKTQPSLNAPRLRSVDISLGWMVADAKAGRYWHICNFGWVDVDDVDTIDIPD